VLLTTVETEITKIEVQSQWRKIVRPCHKKYLITTEISALEWDEVSRSNIGTLLGSVLGLGCLIDPQYRLQQNQPYLLLTGNKLTQIQNLRSYIYFHFTLLRRNLHVATALTYL
jgi:hypothetical protein